MSPPDRPGRRRARIAGMAAAAVAVALLAAPPVAADPFPATTQGVADSLDHWYCFSAGVPAGSRQTYHDSLAYMDARVALHDVYTSTCGTATDVVYNEGDLAGTTRGERTCVRWVNASVCDQSWISVDPGRILTETANHGGGQANFDVNYIKTIRHETGHTLGLNNDGVTYSAAPAEWRDCMVSGWVPTSLLWTTYSDHHVVHINAYYT
jgi:hypothetical protein